MNREAHRFLGLSAPSLQSHGTLFVPDLNATLPGLPRPQERSSMCCLGFISSTSSTPPSNDSTTNLNNSTTPSTRRPCKLGRLEMKPKRNKDNQQYRPLSKINQGELLIYTNLILPQSCERPCVAMGDNSPRMHVWNQLTKKKSQFNFTVVLLLQHHICTSYIFV